MSEFGLQVNMSDDDLMIHLFNNLPEENDIILDSLEKKRTSSGPDN